MSKVNQIRETMVQPTAWFMGFAIGEDSHIGQDQSSVSRFLSVGLPASAQHPSPQRNPYQRP
jgi:hypothetical protein